MEQEQTSRRSRPKAHSKTEAQLLTRHIAIATKFPNTGTSIHTLSPRPSDIDVDINVTIDQCKIEIPIVPTVNQYYDNWRRDSDTMAMATEPVPSATTLTPATVFECRPAAMADTYDPQIYATNIDPVLIPTDSMSQGLIQFNLLQKNIIKYLGLITTSIGRFSRDH